MIHREFGTTMNHWSLHGPGATAIERQTVADAIAAQASERFVDFEQAFDAEFDERACTRIDKSAGHRAPKRSTDTALDGENFLVVGPGAAVVGRKPAKRLIRRVGTRGIAVATEQFAAGALCIVARRTHRCARRRRF